MDSATQRELLRTAQSVLDGDADLLEACHVVLSVRGMERADIPREILEPLILVASELDHVPPKRAYGLWEQEALRLTLAGAERYLAKSRPWLVKAFAALIEHLKAEGAS